jgi:hypothetical protein
MASTFAIMAAERKSTSVVGDLTRCMNMKGIAYKYAPVPLNEARGAAMRNGANLVRRQVLGLPP